MAETKPTEVLINGKIYSLEGADPEYLQKVSAYLNDKIMELKKEKSYRILDADYRALFLNLNLVDDYFKAVTEKEALAQKLEEAEKELYSMKHEIVSTRLKLETSLSQQDVLEKRVEEWKEKVISLVEKSGDENL